eukprot:273814_1
MGNTTKPTKPQKKKNWLEFEINDLIDGRARWGHWYEATIKFHKKPNEPLPQKLKLSKTQEKDIERLEKLEGIYVRYKAWKKKWDEWIFIDPSETICTCQSPCEFDKTKHRIAPPK